MDNEEPQPDSIADAQKRERLKERVLKTGESFGNYRVVKCLCAGLLAHYYHMQHIRDLHDVTVGVFHHRTAGNVKFINRLEALKKTVSTFDHEAIPKIRDCTTVNERVCIFLDPVKGHTLSKHFEAHATPGQVGVGLKAATRLIALLLGALGYAHSQGLDHRDLDSDLIYVQEDGSIRILGLGIKAALGVELFESIVSASVSPLVATEMAPRLNSFDVMSPEYKAGISEDSRVDVYASGVIGYWLLTACKPQLSKYEEPTKLVEDISPNWNTFFEKSLECVQDKRYPSCKMALLGLKETDLEPQSGGAGFVQRQIDRIPVPKGIVDRGELATGIYRLFLIGLVGITLTALAASFLKDSYTEEVDYIRDVAKLADSAENTVARILIKPPVAKVEFIGFKESYIANGGELALAVQPGKYQLRLTAPHHMEQKVALDIPVGATDVKELSIELKPAWTDIEIHTEAEAAVSVIDTRGVEIELGVANEEGVFSLLKGIFAGTYEIIVTKDGYEPKSIKNKSLKPGSVTIIDAPLNPLPARVKVLSEPLGAVITINDVEVGMTPINLKDVIPTKQHLVIARLEGYRPVGRRVYFEPGSNLTIDFGELVPLSGSLRFDITVSGEDAPAPEALFDKLEVLIDGKPVYFGSKALERVLAGERSIQLRHPSYISEEVILNIEDREEYNMEFTLSPRPGVVDLKIPGGLKPEIRINRKLITAEESKVEIPANAEVEFELRIRNHLTMVRTFKLSPNETLVWDVNPVPIPGPTVGQSWTLPYFGIPFAWIPSGKFAMGSSMQEHARLPNEGPQTEVSLTKGYWAGMYEITQAQFLEIMERNPSQFKKPAHPVENVSWADAKIFCELLTNFEKDAGRLPEGYIYRLPTEAEWEYAARGGTDAPFSFGSEADASMGNFRGVYPRDRQDGARDPGGYGTKTVGRYEANAYGLHDVHGNVREWTLEMYNGRLEGKPVVDPKPRADGGRVTVRGGGWEDLAPRVRSAAREQVSPDTVSNALGFRVVLAPEL